MAQSYGIHWFRRDLRRVGNPALSWNLRQHQGRVVGVFCFDHVFLSREDFSRGRFQFFLESLKALREELREGGGDLLFLDVGPDQAFAELFEKLARSSWGLPRTVTFNRDYEPFALARDARMSAWFERVAGVPVHTERDHVLLEPGEVGKDDSESPWYVVYSPYRRKWLEQARRPEVRARVEDQRSAQAIPMHLSWSDLLGERQGPDLLPEYLERNGRNVSVPIPRAGTRAALEKLRQFVGARHHRYAEARDVPGEPGTSQISIYLKNGSITVPQIIAEMDLLKNPEDKYLHELIWREFYYSILAHFPRVEQEPFQTKYANLPWKNDLKLFEAWKQGRTGYPIVDAGMRQLNATGWMHNRVRMIVASFLTKDLHIDYRWGERYFMEKLLDGDLAPNNGGWQWAASTGVDPQPYFRIFNPTLQGKRYDPDGVYVRHWVPELSGASSRDIHEPRDPVVDHAVVSKQAVAMYKAVGPV